MPSNTSQNGTNLSVDCLYFCHCNKRHVECERITPLPLLQEKSVWHS